MRLAVLTSHPIQYYAPIFSELARRMDVVVYFAHKATPEQQAAAGFGTAFDWDVDLLSGYAHEFLRNAARDPGVHHFGGCDTPEIAAKLKRNGFDALLVTGWNLKTYWQGVLAAKQNGIRVLVRGDSHLDTPRAFAKRALKRLAYPPLLSLFDAALYVGQRNLAYWRAYGYPERRLFFSPHCVDVDFFAARATEAARQQLRSRLGIAPEKPAALFAGRLVPFKRPLDLIKAARLVRDDGVDLHVLVAGSGELETEIAAAARAEGVPIHMLGFQNQSDMPAAYAASDVVVLPSSGEETWGLVANEALACRRPIIVSDEVGCAPDLADNDSTGRSVPMGDTIALSKAIKHTLEKPASANDFETTNARHSVAAAAKGVEDAINALHRTSMIKA